MKSGSLLASLLLALVLPRLAAAAEASVDETPTFHVCSAFVDGTELSHLAQRPDRPAVVLQLSPDGTQALEAFTRSHLGKRVRLVAGSTPIVQATLHAVIDSGRVQAPALDAERARRLMQALADAPPEPCGEQTTSAPDPTAGEPRRAPIGSTLRRVDWLAALAAAPTAQARGGFHRSAG